MKQFLFCMIFIVSFNTISTSIYSQSHRPNTTNHKEENLSLYSYYFIAKELCKTPMYAFFIDYKKVENAQITCCKCNHNINSLHLWVYSILNTQEPLLKKFMNFASNESTEEITPLFLRTYQELQIPCNICKKYNGYYIQEKQTLSQD